MKPFSLVQNPRFGELREILKENPGWLTPWSGHFFRFQTIRFPSAGNILSGLGAKARGGRWNPPGLAAVYGSSTDSAALEESKANDRYYGVETKAPRILVTIHADVRGMLDLRSPVLRRRLGVTLDELNAEDWRRLVDQNRESLTQAMGRAAASMGASGILAHSAAVHRAHNVILFPPLRDAGVLRIVGDEDLLRLRGPRKS